MTQIYWKPAVKDVLELVVTVNGHKLSEFNNMPPEILQSGESFEARATCLACGDFLSLEWDGKIFNARGASMYGKCAKAV